VVEGAGGNASPRAIGTSPELATAIDERIESVRSGETKPIPARAAMARLRRQRYSLD
jgi:hypothetical protein